jgi:hypothetical protein
MKTLILAAVATLLLAAIPVHAVWEIDQATPSESDCVAPSVASSGTGLTMIGYSGSMEPIPERFAFAQLVPTNPSTDEAWPEPVLFNSGSSPRICWTREGFVAVVASGPVILIYESDIYGNWDLANYEMLDPGGEVMGIDLWGVPTDAAGPYVFLTVMISRDPPNSDFQVRYAAGTSLGWSDFEVVAEEPVMMPFPQITYSFGPAGPWPTIFYLTGEPGTSNLVYTTKDLAAGWSTPVPVPGDGASGPSPIEGFFDVVTHGDLNRSVLGLGAQPTCPCGSIHHLAFNAGSGWAPQEHITSHHAEMDWPKSPHVDADPAGGVHAFWYQRGSGMDLEPVTRTLEYWVKTETGWIEKGGFLDGQENGGLGEYVDLDVSPAGEVVMAWSRNDSLNGEPLPRQIWIARPYHLSDVPGPGVKSAVVALSAWPNPFNPSVQLAMDVPVAGSAHLDIYDVRGRLVVQLFDGFLPEGRREIEWNGRDAGGRSVPSGVYFARLETAAGRAVQKLVLAE